MKLPISPGGLKTVIVDIEVFQNYFYACFTNGDRFKEFDHTTRHDLQRFLQDSQLCLAGYNSFAYDNIILGMIADDCCPDLSDAEFCLRVYQTSKTIIFDKSEQMREKIFAKTWQERPWGQSIDVFALLNNKGSLKEWACKIGTKLVAETPVNFDLPLPADKVEEMKMYCKNDVNVTKELLIKNWDLVILRETLKKQFDLHNNVYCLSEQAVAQTTFMTLHRKRTGQTTAVVREFAKLNEDNLRTEFALPELISTKVVYSTEEFQSFFAGYREGKTVCDDKGTWKLDAPAVNNGLVKLAGRTFTMGVGGIHTVDEPAIFDSTETHALIDLDVASYYPSLIIEENLYPKHIGPEFVDDMRLLRDRRMAAKRTGDKRTANALKIVINATFGKLNDKYSPIRSVPDAMRVTLNGQLFILMLVELLHSIGCEILSANTDGVTVRMDRTLNQRLVDVIARWQAATKMELERVDYASIFRRDISNYLAITIDGKVKHKGIINAETGKGDGMVVKRAVEAYLVDGIPPDITLQNATTPTDWLFYLRSKNGGTLWHDGVELGKSARWYVSKSGTPLKRLNPKRGDKDATWAAIPNGSSARMALDLNGVSIEDWDIDYDFYERQCWDMINSMGPTKVTP